MELQASHFQCGVVHFMDISNSNNSILNNLLELSNIDSDIRRLKEKVSEVINIINQPFTSDYLILKDDYNRFAEIVNNTKREIERVNIDITKRNNEITKIKSSIRKFKTNREYDVAFKNIDKAASDINRLREGLAPLNRKLLINVDYMKLKGKELTQKKNEIDRAIDRNKEEIVSLNNLLNNLASARETLIERFNGKFLNKFKKIYSRYPDTYVVLLSPDDICNGCSVRIPKQVAVDISKKIFTEVIECPNCSRFLYTKNYNPLVEAL
jgi:predicted  nucleic acid-binding Zn-ribbon protein